MITAGEGLCARKQKMVDPGYKESCERECLTCPMYHDLDDR